MADIAELISKVKDYEEQAVSSFVGDLANREFHSADQRRYVARDLFRAERRGVPHITDEWALFIEGLPVLALLTLHPKLIVDLRPYDEKTFAKTYGVTPHQFAELVRRDYVIPNLYEFDSDRVRGFEKHRAHTEVLGQIIQPDFTRCRINSIRRTALFSIFGANKKDYNQHVSQGMDIFHDAVLAIDADLLKELTRSADANGATTRLAQNWAYVKVLGSQDEQFSHWLSGVEKSPPKNSPDAEEAIRSLVFFKRFRTNGYTASFGGTWNMRGPELQQGFKDIGRLVAVFETDSHLSPELEAFAAGLAEIGLKRTSLTTDLRIERHLGELGPPSDEEFESILSFLVDARGLLNRTEVMLQTLHAASADPKKQFSCIEDILDVRRQIHQEQKRLQLRNDILTGLFGGIGAIIGSGVGAEVGHGLIAAGVGGVVGVLMGMRHFTKLLPSLSEHQIQVVDYFSALESWQREDGGVRL